MHSRPTTNAKIESLDQEDQVNKSESVHPPEQKRIKKETHFIQPRGGATNNNDGLSDGDEDEEEDEDYGEEEDEGLFDNAASKQQPMGNKIKVEAPVKQESIKRE